MWLHVLLAALLWQSVNSEDEGYFEQYFAKFEQELKKNYDLSKPQIACVLSEAKSMSLDDKFSLEIDADVGEQMELEVYVNKILLENCKEKFPDKPKNENSSLFWNIVAFDIILSMIASVELFKVLKNELHMNSRQNNL